MSRSLPSEETALRLLKDVGCSKSVIEHSKTVTHLVLKIAEGCGRKGLEVNVNLVRIGALLHDIGRARTHDVDHAIVGARIAKEHGLPLRVLSIIERHIGGGISKEEAERLRFPKKSYIPISIEERLVAYADKMVEGSTAIPIRIAVERFLRNSHIPAASVERLMKWHEEFHSCLE